MQLLIYYRLFKQNWYVFVVSLLIGVFLSVFLVGRVTPVYSATSQIFVSTPASAIDISALNIGSNFTQQRVKSYAQIINSPLTLNAVIDELKLKMSSFELAEQVSAIAPLDTVLINISVSDISPTMASKIANSVAENFGKVVSNLEMTNATDTRIKVSPVRLSLPPTNPIKPNKIIFYGLGIIFGFLFGLSISLLRRSLDTSVKNEDDLEDYALLAAIGFDKSAQEKPLLTEIGRYSARTENFRTLRTNIKYIIPSIPAKVLSISSALPHEGKTTTAINLAISLAQGGSRAFLIEGDMRRPKVNKYLDTQIDHRKGKEITGLSELLKSKKILSAADIKKSIVALKDSSVHLMRSGNVPSNPAELLGSENFKILLNFAKRNYDYVLIDTPPLLPVTDAAVISSQVDGVVLVIHAGKTRKAEFQGCISAIEAVGGRILGIVLNKIPAGTRGSYYKYGYRYNPTNTSNEAKFADSYKPSREEIHRIEREEFFNRIATPKRHELLTKVSNLYDKKRS